MASRTATSKPKAELLMSGDADRVAVDEVPAARSEAYLLLLTLSKPPNWKESAVVLP